VINFNLRPSTKYGLAQPDSLWDRLDVDPAAAGTWIPGNEEEEDVWGEREEVKLGGGEVEVVLGIKGELEVQGDGGDRDE